MRGWLTTSGRGFCSASEALLAVAVLSTALSALPGCSSCAGGSTNPIVSIQVLDRAPRLGATEAKIDRAELEARTREAIKRWPGFKERVAKASEIGWQLTVEVQLVVEEDAKETDAGPPKEGQVHRTVAVAMSLAALRSAAQASGLPARFEAQALESRDADKKDPIDRLALQAVDDAAASIRAAIELGDAKEDQVIAALKSKDRGTRARAIVMSGQRKLKGAVPILSELVRSDEEDPDLILKSIGSLVAIGDERAVGPLIDAGRRRPPAYLGQILFAVAQLGGKEAEAYLFTVSTGHPDPEVKKNANDALEELERRKEQKRQAAKGAKEDGAKKVE